MKTLKQKTGIYSDASARMALEDAYAIVDKVDTYVGDNEHLDEAHRAINEALVAISDALDAMGHHYDR